MKTTPVLSIIVPVYQAESYLKKCIDSILNQTFSDFELILIDDGSNDGSGKICDEYAFQEKRVRVIHKTNEGQAIARNTGLDLARGEYIGFVDNDDRIMPDMYEVLISNIKNTPADISCCSFIQENENGSIEPKQSSLIKKELSNSEGVREFLSREYIDIYVWTKIYRKSFLQANNIRFEAGKIDEDFLFNFEAFRMAKVSVAEDIPKYIYFHRKKSASRIFHQKHLREYLTMTLYRVDKILGITERDYPEFGYLANRQKIKYCFIMLKIITRAGKSTCSDQYMQIVSFLKQNIKQIYRERTIIGCTPIGIILLYFLPSNVYFIYRATKERFFKKTSEFLF
ncbi:MAG: glycosyltransferase [Mangrovibacterium sp.]|nr:glycosyltransferase [Mangrovibacterium sp.]